MLFCRRPDRFLDQNHFPKQTVVLDLEAWTTFLIEDFYEEHDVNRQPVATESWPGRHTKGETSQNE
jgi:hypothetical protein